MDPPPSLPAQSSHPFKIILGSSSSSRRLILEEMGYQFSIMTADIDEKAIRMEEPEELVMTLAQAKADAILEKLKGTDGYYTENDDGQPTLLITADQVVVHEGVIREKPSSKEEARQFVKSYSNGCASTVGSVLVTNLKTGIKKGACDTAEVYFHEIPDEVIDNLIEEGTVLYVAGGLLVESPLTSPFVSAMVGTIDSVMGFPKDLAEKLIQEALQTPSLPIL
ncbi:Maf family protein, putative, expressed [Zostera marina]|uniref:Maf family protein, putative, expressed n=1 Tax=Zostera marina TaxID=29655 RepID=A0A0K9NID8_ZOSMR|nr:Maf family protein, putative, expressed [Zostera marina]